MMIILIDNNNNTSVCYELYPLMCFGCFHNLAILNKCFSQHSSTDISLRFYFHFLWIYTQSWNCWIVWYF